MSARLHGQAILLLVGRVSRDHIGEGLDPHRCLDEAVCSIARAVLAAGGRLVMPFDPDSTLVVSQIVGEYLAPTLAEEVGSRFDSERPRMAPVTILGGRSRKPNWIAPLEEARALTWKSATTLDDGETPRAIVVVGAEVQRMKLPQWFARYPETEAVAFASLGQFSPARRHRVRSLAGELLAEVRTARERIQWQSDPTDRVDGRELREVRRPAYPTDPFAVLAQHFVAELARRGESTVGS